MTLKELQRIREKRMEALDKAGYTNFDIYYSIHEELRRLYGPDIIRQLERLKE